MALFSLMSVHTRRLKRYVVFTCRAFIVMVIIRLPVVRVWVPLSYRLLWCLSVVSVLSRRVTVICLTMLRSGKFMRNCLDTLRIVMRSLPNRILVVILLIWMIIVLVFLILLIVLLLLLMKFRVK